MRRHAIAVHCEARWCICGGDVASVLLCDRYGTTVTIVWIHGEMVTQAIDDVVELAAVAPRYSLIAVETCSFNAHR